MTIGEIREFMSLYQQGDETIDKRRAFVQKGAIGSSASWKSSKVLSTSSPTNAGATVRQQKQELAMLLTT